MKKITAIILTVAVMVSLAVSTVTPAYAESSEKTVFITSKMYYKAYDAEDETTKCYIQGQDIETGETEMFVIANEDPNDIIFTESDIYFDLRCRFFVLTAAEDGYYFTPALDAGWVEDTVSAVSSKAIQLVNGGIINSGDECVKDAKVYVRNANTSVVASGFSAITTAKSGAKNIMLKYDREKITDIIFSSNPSYSVASGYYGSFGFINGLSINSLPAKTVYLVGEELDLNGFSLRVTDQNGYSAILTKGYDVYSVSTEVPGVKTVTVAYRGRTVKFDITVKESGENDGKLVIDIGEAKELAGGEVSVKAVISSDPGVSYLELTPEYPSGLTLESVLNGDIITDLTTGKQLLWLSDADACKTGTLVTLTFKIADDAEAGEYSIGFTVRGCLNNAEQDVPVVVNEGKVTVLEYLAGDANGDGEVNGKDVVRLKKYIAGFDYTENTSDTEIFPGADVNGDGKADGRDLLRLKKQLSDVDYGDSGWSPLF